MKIWITISFILYADEKYLDLCLVYYTWFITGWNTICYKFVIEHVVLGLVLEVIWWLLYMKFSLKIQQNLIEKTQNCLLHEQDCRTDRSSQARKLVSLFPPFFCCVRNPSLSRDARYKISCPLFLPTVLSIQCTAHQPWRNMCHWI